MKYVNTLFVCGISTFSGTACAQAPEATVTLTPDTVVSPLIPYTNVFIDFIFTPDPSYTSFATMNFDISVADGEWTGASGTFEFTSLVFPPGTAFPSQSFTDVLAFAWPLGPPRLAKFRWATDDFTPRAVDISFVVNGLPTLYLATGGTGPVSGTTVITTSIQIIPAPTTPLAFLGAAGAVGVRRRR